MLELEYMMTFNLIVSCFGTCRVLKVGLALAEVVVVMEQVQHRQWSRSSLSGFPCSAYTHAAVLLRSLFFLLLDNFVKFKLISINILLT